MLALSLPRISGYSEAFVHQRANEKPAGNRWNCSSIHGNKSSCGQAERKKTTGNDLTKTPSSPIAPIFQWQGMSNAWTRNPKKEKKQQRLLLVWICTAETLWACSGRLFRCAAYGLHFPNERASMCRVPLSKRFMKMN